ncbi:hypothetical protein [Trichothermofontia sp.]
MMQHPWPILPIVTGTKLLSSLTPLDLVWAIVQMDNEQWARTDQGQGEQLITSLGASQIDQEIDQETQRTVMSIPNPSRFKLTFVPKTG